MNRELRRRRLWLPEEAMAQENEVPLYEDGELSDTLMRLEIGDTIPPELYKVVADILVFVDNMDKIKGKLNSTKKKQ